MTAELGIEDSRDRAGVQGMRPISKACGYRGYSLLRPEDT